MQDEDPRENPANRPHLPEESDDNEMHCTERSIQDPQMMEDMTCSNESIIEDVRKFFKMHNRGSDFIEVDGNNKANGVQLMQTLDKTFGDKAWLDKQTHVEGKIKVGDLADRINLDKIEQTIAETGAINAQFQNAQVQAILTNIKLLKPILDKINPTKLTDDGYDTLKALLPDIKPITEIIKTPVRSKTNLLSGKTTDEARETLKVDEVEGIAQAINKALKEAQAIWEDSGTTIDQLIPTYIEIRQNINDGAQSQGYNNDAWNELFAMVHRKIFGAGSPDVIAAYRQFEGACIAAVIYMERSFKGGKGVSMEEFKVSIEGIFDKIIGMFKKKKEGDKEPIKPPMNIDHVQELKRFVESGATTLPATTTTGMESSFLVGLDKSANQWAAAVRADLKNYRQLIQQAITYDKKIDAWEKKYADELDSYCGNDDRPEEFAALLKRVADSQPKPWSEVMNKSQSFIAFGPDDWMDDEGSFESMPHPDMVKGQLDIPEMNEPAVKLIKEVLKEIVQFVDFAEDLYYDLPYHGADFTDAPYRGYTRDDDCNEQMSRFRIHAYVSNNPADMAHHISKRVFHLLMNITSFVVRAEGGSVSNEGFIDALKGLFKSKPKDVEIKGDIDNSVLKQLQETVLNDNWLKQQTLKEGNVSVRFPDAVQNGNYKPVLQRVKQELETTAKYNAGKANAWLNPIKQAMDVIIEGRVSGISLEQAEALRELADYDSLDFDVDYKEPNNFLSDDAEVEVPALDEAGIKGAVNAIIELVKARELYTNVSTGDIPGGIPHTSMHKIREVSDEATRDVLLDLHEEISSITDYAIESFYQNQSAYFDLFEALAKPLMDWIQKSISGIKYSNEAFADVGKL
jgi:hypothetical protein